MTIVGLPLIFGGCRKVRLTAHSRLVNAPIASFDNLEHGDEFVSNESRLRHQSSREGWQLVQNLKVLLLTTEQGSRVECLRRSRMHKLDKDIPLGQESLKLWSTNP